MLVHGKGQEIYERVKLDLERAAVGIMRVWREDEAAKAPKEGDDWINVLVDGWEWWSARVVSPWTVRRRGAGQRRKERGRELTLAFVRRRSRRTSCGRCCCLWTDPTCSSTRARTTFCESSFLFF